jgi:hypothetical protein
MKLPNLASKQFIDNQNKTSKTEKISRKQKLAANQNNRYSNLT